MGIIHVNGIIMDSCGPLWIGISPVNVDRKLWKIMGSHNAISWDNSRTLDWVMFNSKLLNYQRVPSNIKMSCKTLSQSSEVSPKMGGIQKTTPDQRKKLFISLTF